MKTYRRGFMKYRSHRAFSVRGGLAAFAVCLCLAAASLAGCRGDTSNPERVGTTAARYTAANATPYLDLGLSALDSLTNTAQTDGLVPISLSAYGTTSSPSFAVVLAPNEGPPWHLVRGPGDFQAAFNTQAGMNYKPTLLSFDGPIDNPVWAALFVQTSSGIPLTRNGLVLGDDGAATPPVDDDTTVQYWLAFARHENLIPSTLTIYGTADSPAYALVLEPNTANVDWVAGVNSMNFTNGVYNVSQVDGLNDSVSDYQARFNAQTIGPPVWTPLNRPALLDLNDTLHYVSMFRDDSLNGFFSTHDASIDQYNAIAQTQAATGFFPITIAAAGVPPNATYAAVFAPDYHPQTRQFTARGSSDGNDTSLPAVDQAVQGFMARNNVRQASLAVVKGTRLAYARGYTYAEPGYPLVDPTTTFRMASVTKVVTAMEIARLLDQRNLSLTDTAEGILQLQGLNASGQNVAPDPRFANITLQELLTFVYPSLGTDPGTGQPLCLLTDASVGQDVANAFGVSLPVTLEQSVRFALARSDLIWTTTPTSNDCYSNFAYDLLALIAQTKRGMAFFTALQSDLFSPLSITRAHVGVADVLSQPANEAIYRSPGLSTGPSLNVPGALVPFTYGPNFEATVGAGALSMASVDMVRMLAMLNLRGANPVYSDLTYADCNPSTIDQILSVGPSSPTTNGVQYNGGAKPLGFDWQDQTNGHYYKGGSIDGLQSTAWYLPGGLSYVLFWAYSNVANAGCPVPPDADAAVQTQDYANCADNWWPTWTTLENALGASGLDSRVANFDFFPDFGLPTFPAGPPPPPAGLSAVAGNGQVTLSWQASPGATSYLVRRSTSPVCEGGGGAPTNWWVTTPVVGQTNLTTFTDTGLTDGVPFWYVVQADGTGGVGAPSAVAEAAPNAPPPPAVTGLTAVAGNAEVTLSWNPSPGATGYVVERGTTSGTYTFKTTGLTTTTYTDTGLTNGTTYYYVVQAYSLSAGNGPLSNEETATPIAGASNPCAAFCGSPTTFAGPNHSSGNLGTGAVCYQTTSVIHGGNCGNFVGPRRLSVNGIAEPCAGANWSSVPAAVNGGYCIQTTAGNQSYAYFTTW